MNVFRLIEADRCLSSQSIDPFFILVVKLHSNQRRHKKKRMLLFPSMPNNIQRTANIFLDTQRNTTLDL